MVKNALIINGSPKGDKSNTLKIARAFAEGTGYSVVTVSVKDLNIEPCRSCYYCWAVNPGVCVIDDDFKLLMEKYKSSDLVIWSVPIFAFGVPSKTKALMDRTLSQCLPYVVQRPDGTDTHPSRYERRPKQVLVSTSGFYTTENNYDGFLQQFRIYFRDDGYTRIICTAGAMLDMEGFEEPIRKYLDTAKKAGAEFVSGGRIEDGTQKILSTPFVSHEEYVRGLNAMWDSYEPALKDRKERGIELP